MFDKRRVAALVPGVIAKLKELQELLRDREAANAPEALAFSADVIRALLAMLGTTQSGMARTLGVNERTVRDWCSARVPPGPPAVLAMRLLAERTVLPLAGQVWPAMDRTCTCAEALAPHLTVLAHQAANAGWSPDEIVAAVAAWSNAIKA